jgi:hypothetical protein
VVIVQGGVSPDHVPMLVSVHPQLAAAKLVQYLKGRSSRMLQDEFPQLKKRDWGQHLWARGYFCASVGAVDEDTRKYAWRRPEAECDVQLCDVGATYRCGSSGAFDSCVGGPCFRAYGRGSGCDVFVQRPSVDCSGASLAGAVADGSPLDPVRASTDGTAGLQPVVSLVRGAGDGRPGVGCDGVYQEPGASDRRRGEPAVAGGGAGRGPRA